MGGFETLAGARSSTTGERSLLNHRERRTPGSRRAASVSSDRPLLDRLWSSQLLDRLGFCSGQDQPEADKGGDEA
jgi:hypothetical protein